MRIDHVLSGGGDGGEANMVGSNRGLSFLPPEVADVSVDTLKNFAHTKRVGNYLLGRTLGEGSFAKVKEGLHNLTGEKVAVKVIDKKKAREDAYVRKNLRREGKLLQMVHHRHIMRLFEIMETENSYYLVTELCAGGDLMEHICNRKRLDEKETRKYVRQVLSAVDYLHKMGILHRDLKVENLLLDANKDIKIIDFGLSNAVEVRRTSEQETVFHEFCVTQCGSPAYAAPELLGNNKYGPKVDIWSIGVNMYAMLTGSLPFTVEPFNIKALHKKMLKGDMNPTPDHLTKNCRDLMKRFLKPNPEERIAIDEAMKHPWICEGFKRPVEPAPVPNKITREDMVDNILKHMSHQFDLRPAEVVRLVTGNVPNSATATYCLLAQRLVRYQAERDFRQRVNRAANYPHLDRVRSPFEVTGSDVIELVPVSNNKEAVSREGPRSSSNISGQEPKVLEMTMVPRRLPKDLDPKSSRRSRLTHARSVRQDSVDHSPGPASPRRGAGGQGRRQNSDTSPGRKGGTIRRGSTSLQAPGPKRGLLPPRSQSQDTDGSGTALPDVMTLRDLEVDAERSDQASETGQLIHMPHEGVRTEKPGQQKSGNGKQRAASARNTTNLPAVNTRDRFQRPRDGLMTDHVTTVRQSSFDYTPSPEPGKPRPAQHLGVDSERGRQSPGCRFNDRNNNREYNMGRLSPCWTCRTNPRMAGHVSCLDSDHSRAVGLHNSSHSTTSSIGRQSGLSTPAAKPNPSLKPTSDLTVAGSDPLTRGEWRSARPSRTPNLNQNLSNNNNNGSKPHDSMPKKLVIDSGQYDRYARATGRIHTIASADVEGIYVGAHRRLINLMYPSHHQQRSRHIASRKSQTSRGVGAAVAQGHGQQTGENFLGVTGERSHVTNRGSPGLVRNPIQNPHISPRSVEAVEEMLMEMPRDCLGAVSPVSRAGSRSPSPAYLGGGSATQKVALPAISPPPLNYGNSSRMHIEDLDK